jgi:glycosyltransferase involved in cell wall biosynthesis
VLPVYNEKGHLQAEIDRITAALEGSQYTWEIIVVDDGSDDGSAEEAEADARAGRPVRVIRTTRQGAVAARRAGVAISDAEVLAFTDSDCTPAPAWLAAGLAAIDAGACLANGRTIPAGPVGLLDHSVASGEEGLYPTCNVFYRRTAYDESGGFDQAATRRKDLRAGQGARMLGFGEDTLLAWRVRRRSPAAYVPEAVVEHQVFHMGFAEAISRAWLTTAFPALVRDVPELRSTVLFRRRISLGPRSRGPVYTLAFALARRRPKLALAAATWWVFAVVRELRRSPDPGTRLVIAVPVTMATDLVVATALVVGSIEARTVVI